MYASIRSPACPSIAALILSFWRECAKLFDVDGDGHINRLEVVTLLDALGMSNLTDDEIDKLVPLSLSLSLYIFIYLYN
jgi:hypothetical protein